MKKAKYTEFVERYFDCPKCNKLISDNENVESIDSGDVIECPECNEKIEIK